MPHLMVNLDDPQDCRKAVTMLQRRIERAGRCDPENADDSRPRGRRRRENAEGNRHENVADLPLPQKLKRLQARGMWKHLLNIAQNVDSAMSLPELDRELELPKNKMRSLKAIMAKLENRFDLQFLKVDHDAGEDASGNPRYIMLPRVRKQILRLSEQAAS